MLSGSTGRFFKDDFGPQPFCAVTLYNPHREGVRYAWYCHMLRQNKTSTTSSENCHQSSDKVTFHMEDNLSGGTGEINVG